MTIPLGRIAEVNPPVPEFAENSDAEVTFLPLECVWPDGKADITRRAKVAAVSTGYTTFRRGDVLIPKITPTFEAGRVMTAVIETAVGAGTTELHVLRPFDGVDSRFIAYLCRSQEFLQDGATRLQGVGNLRRVPADYLRKFPVSTEALSAQRQIANFLDRETAQIDALIEAQQQIMVTLRERRTAIVDLAFSPADGTELTRVRRLLAERPTYGVLVPRYVDDGVPLVRVGDILDLSKERTFVTITDSQSAEYSRTRLRSGEVLLGVVGKMGQSAVVPSYLAGANVARAVAVLRTGRPKDADLLSWWFSTSHFRDQAAIAVGGDTVQPTLGMQVLSNFAVHWPRDEAAAETIRNSLVSQTSRIDTLIAETERFIELSRERRSALITAAVAGQIDVRDEVA